MSEKIPPTRSGASILSFDSVALTDRSDAGTFSLELGPGDFALFFRSVRTNAFPLASLALGLLVPGSGSVSFRGNEWPEMTMVEIEDNRLMIGRVFNQHDEAFCWLQNLTVAENVILAQSMGNRAPVATLYQRAHKLAKDFGMSEIPDTRPTTTSPKDLVRAQWVRAFLPAPLHLLLLEDPEWFAPDGSLVALESQVAAAREAGTAVIWITSEKETFESNSIQPTTRFGEIPAPLLASSPRHAFKQGS